MMRSREPGSLRRSDPELNPRLIRGPRGFAAIPEMTARGPQRSRCTSGYGAAMLPAGSALRLSRALTEASERCGDEERQLREDRGRRSGTVQAGKGHAADILQEEGVATNKTEEHSESSGQVCGRGELQELEVLNKALAKAFRIRQTHGRMLEAELMRVGSPAGSTQVMDRSSTKEARSHSPGVTHGTVSVKEGKAGTQVVPSRSGLSGKRTTAHSASFRKPVAVALKAPYKTEQVGRRRLVWSAAGRAAQCSLQRRPRAEGVVATQHPVQRAGERNLSANPTLRTFRRHVQTPADPDAGSAAPFPLVKQQTEKRTEEPPKASVCKGDKLQTDTSIVEMPILITLHTSRSSLQLPATWRKQHIRSMRLWDKVSKSKAIATQGRTHFMERIQSAFHSQLPSVSNAEIEERLDHISDLYRCINQYMYTDSLLNSIDALSCQREREREQALDRCQETLSSLLHCIQQLRDGAGAWMKVGMCWRPVFKACGNASGERAPLLLYSSLEELKELEYLRFQVQTLQQQIHIQTVLMEELIPLISAQQPPPHLYRAAYSLLCEGGQHFPALVLDNVSD
ncbi:tubulin epsilon and delta complex protein 2 [Mobula hypostoma]|uniref:tubulin epsilon and delta complex protein 2 n=1 Tax=Mobula hypostoma TaxID=723540 RepID=UPI002FC293E8